MFKKVWTFMHNLVFKKNKMKLLRKHECSATFKVARSELFEVLCIKNVLSLIKSWESGKDNNFFKHMHHHKKRNNFKPSTTKNIILFPTTHKNHKDLMHQERKIETLRHSRSKLSNNQEQLMKKNMNTFC